jgi:hypothetical protein
MVMNRKRYMPVVYYTIMSRLNSNTLFESSNCCVHKMSRARSSRPSLSICFKIGTSKESLHVAYSILVPCLSFLIHELIF